MKVAVKPEVKIGNYSGLTVEKTVHTVTDEAVDAELKRVQERNARELTREGAAQNGDITDIDFDGPSSMALLSMAARQSTTA